ncbi:MAG TPA: cupin domain-containing protein [Thermoanaerobaculia bacterium]|jgi:quercetin dioxygenase-like cupin family protein|nr:cupin domain-containing protein [Thermoanaerobaculia bacterium]
MTIRKGLAVIAVAASALAAAAGQTPADKHVMQSVAEAKWGPAPPFVPPGAQIAVLSGNPMAAESYTVRLKFPANYAIAAHSHPTDENVAVVSGTLYMGMGDKLDKQAGHAVAPGGYALMPAKANHYAFTKEPVTIFLYGIGPVEFNYVNPADDPRNAAKK